MVTFFIVSCSPEPRRYHTSSALIFSLRSTINVSASLGSATITYFRIGLSVSSRTADAALFCRFRRGSVCLDLAVESFTGGTGIGNPFKAVALCLSERAENVAVRLGECGIESAGNFVDILTVIFLSGLLIIGGQNEKV